MVTILICLYSLACLLLFATVIYFILPNYRWYRKLHIKLFKSTWFKVEYKQSNIMFWSMQKPNDETLITEIENC